MRLKTKKDEITPWQTYEEKTLITPFLSHSLKIKNQDINDNLLQVVDIKSKTREQKRMPSIESIIRLKTSNQITQYDHLSPHQKIRYRKIKELIPLNSNLINIMNSVHQNGNKINPQAYKQRPNMKKITKDNSRNVKTERNKFLIDTQVSTFNKRKQQIQNLKRSLFYKLNPSLDSLLKAKQRLSHINEAHNQPILKSYSVRTMRLNSIEQKDIDGISNIKRIDNSKLGTYFSSTTNLNNFRPSSDLRNDVIRKRTISSSVGMKQNAHVIDRLFDRFQ